MNRIWLMGQRMDQLHLVILHYQIRRNSKYRNWKFGVWRVMVICCWENWDWRVIFIWIHDDLKNTSEAGLEPATYGLGGRCATITPHGLYCVLFINHDYHSWWLELWPLGILQGTRKHCKLLWCHLLCLDLDSKLWFVFV